MHFLSAEQINPENLESVLSLAARMQDEPTKGYSLQDKIIATIFHERSTRTRLSFESAAIRLGAKVITENDGTSSCGKGESLSDTLRTVSQYADAIVLRHAARLQLATEINVPVISAGDGDHEHPTQALLDLYTIQRELGLDRKLKLLMIGDLLASRTVRSLMFVLRLYENIEVVAAPSRDSLGGKHFLFSSKLEDSLGRPIKTVSDDQIDDLLSEVDIVYMTRRQSERYAAFEGRHERIPSRSCEGDFVFKEKHLGKLKSSAIIMHPMPRCQELCSSVDSDPRAVFHTKQIANGLYVRMALLYLACRWGWPGAIQSSDTRQ